MPAFSTRNSTEPPLAPATACATSMVTVPTFGFGIRPRGPSTFPRRPTRGIMFGVARIDAEVERDLDGLVELRLGRVLDELHRLFEGVELVAIDRRLCRGEPLAGFAHDYS